MDIQTLSQQLITSLAPFLPYLLKMGEQAAEEAAKKFGAEAWEGAKALWARLKPKVEAKPASQEAVTDLAANPQNEKAQTALQWQLEKLLAEDQALAREVQQALETPAAQQVIAQNERSVAIGGDASGGVIITGDQNTVQQGKYNIQIDRAAGLAIGDGARVEQPDDQS